MTVRVEVSLSPAYSGADQSVCGIDGGGEGIDPAVLIHEIDPFIPVSGSHIAKELQSAFRILSQGDYAILAVVSGEIFKGDGLDLSGRKFSA